jgi:hypothetical protein
MEEQYISCFMDVTCDKEGMLLNNSSTSFHLCSFALYQDFAIEESRRLAQGDLLAAALFC